MKKETFDLAIHLGPGVSALKPAGEEVDEDGEVKKRRRGKTDEDDPREEVRCSFKLCLGIGGSFFIGGLLTVLIILYLACLLPHQTGDVCYYRQPTVGSPL